MRIQGIDLYSNDKLIINFNVAGPDFENPYKLKAMTGTDADEITPLFYGQGEVSNTKYYDMMLQPRDIDMRIGLNPNYNLDIRPGDLRGEIYKAIASSRSGLVQLRFKDDEIPVAVISGFVTKLQAPVSTREPEIQLTIRCSDSLFKSYDAMAQEVTSLSKTAPLIIDPVSTAPHGFKFRLTFTGSVNPFIFKDPGDDWLFRINYAFLNGDQLYFSSVNGDKYIYRVRGGSTLHLMDVLAQGSVWPILFPGENQFAINTSSFNWNEVYWYDTHWGI